MDKVVRVGSLGAGVQSSTMIFLCNDGKINPPDFWVFADTQAEPREVYNWLEYLKTICKQEIIVTTKGDIVADTLSGSRFASAPFFIKKSKRFINKEIKAWEEEIFQISIKLRCSIGKAKKVHRNKPKQIVMGRRQCTNEYKIQQIKKCVREQLGYKPKTWMRHSVEMLIGISTDEIQRVTISKEKWIKNIYPLTELDMSRNDCYSYFDLRSEKRPPRSACWFCPYKRDIEWIHLRDNNPVEFEMACEFDEKIRSLKKFKHKNYLHQSCIPLREVVFKEKKNDVKMGLINECEGMCGL